MAFRTSVDLSRGGIKIGHYHIESWLHEAPELIQGESLPPITEWIGRQYKLRSGVADLVGVQANGDISLIEVKLFRVNRPDIWQVQRYGFDIDRIVAKRYRVPSVHRIIVASGCSPDILEEARSFGIKVFAYSVIGELSIYTGLILQALWPEGILHHG